MGAWNADGTVVSVEITEEKVVFSSKAKENITINPMLRVGVALDKGGLAMVRQDVPKGIDRKNAILPFKSGQRVNVETGYSLQQDNGVWIVGGGIITLLKA